jgi:hypothetical protein
MSAELGCWGVGRFAVDALARDRNRDDPASHVPRLVEVAPKLAPLREELESGRGSSMPSSEQGNAAHDTLSL